MNTTIKILKENLELFKTLNTEGEEMQIGNYTKEIKELEKVISVLNNGVIINYDLILKEIYSGIGLESNDKEFFGICMRDSGFEFNYEGINYSAQKGTIKKLSKALILHGVGVRSKQLFCGGCGHKRELNRYTDLNSGRSCQNRLCKEK